MAVQAKVGTFVRPTTAAPFSQSITGVGFQPKAIIFLYMPWNVNGFRSTLFYSMGFCSGATSGAQRAHAFAAADNVSTTTTKSAYHDAVILVVDPLGGILAEADLASFDADGFTVTWVTSDQNPDRLIIYLALGGADLQAKVGDFRAASVAGNQDVTGVGFQPDAVMLMCGLDTVVAQANIGRFRLGAATPSNQWAIALSARNGQTTSANVDAVRAQRTDRVLIGIAPDGSALEAEAEFVQMLADGFRVNWITPPPAEPNRPLVAYLALKVGQYAVGASTKPTGSPPVDQDVAVGFPPIAVFSASWGLPASTAIQGDCEYSVGVFDGSAQGSNWVEAQDAVLPTESNGYRTTTKAMTLATGPSTVDAEAGGSMLSSGFRFSWTTNNATAAQLLYLAVGQGEQPMIASTLRPSRRKV